MFKSDGAYFVVVVALVSFCETHQFSWGCTCWAKKPEKEKLVPLKGTRVRLCQQFHCPERTWPDRSRVVKWQLQPLAFQESRTNGSIWSPLGNSSLLRLWYLWMEFNKRNSLSVEPLEQSQVSLTMQYASKESWTYPLSFLLPYSPCF